MLCIFLYINRFPWAFIFTFRCLYYIAGGDPLIGGVITLYGRLSAASYLPPAWYGRFLIILIIDQISPFLFKTIPLIFCFSHSRQLHRPTPEQ